jgi:DNA-binding NtrC family response regulator
MDEPFNVLLVDDEDDFRQTLKKRLEKRELKVWEAENGQRALDILRKTAIDVVVLDVKMPGMDGIEVLAEIKKAALYSEVILLTGHASVESGIEGMKLGAFDYVMKPVNIDELLHKMRQACERKAIREEKGG